MVTTNQQTPIRNILCPTDLSRKSQKALGYAARIADTLDAQLTACHCAQPSWFSSRGELEKAETDEIKTLIKAQVAKSQRPGSQMTWSKVIVENSLDPARDILDLADETDVDLIVMKARPSVLSAFRFGSIVERVVSKAKCPVLLLPARFLVDRDPAADPLEFRRILFDYDFSQATDELFRVANSLTRGYQAELRLLSVLEPPAITHGALAETVGSRPALQTAIRGKLNRALQSEGRSDSEVSTNVEWGDHADEVLRYAKVHDIDLICTTLAPPQFYFERLYSFYFGNLLREAACPILVKQSR